MDADSAKKALLIHAVAYGAVVALCAALALSHDPPRHWFVWVAAGWGVGLGAHALAVWLNEGHHQTRLLAGPHVRGFAIHAFVYVGVVVVLFGINIAAGRHHWWAIWVALGWGLGVAAHGWAVFRERRTREHPSAERDAS
ncbi:MAG: 2TM domain-containing protein [Methyloceanibacter sp.]|nr:2TM domain-containing protein [Methyloceanibacter sp.]